VAERDPRSGTISLNRKALHDYEILDRVEAGVVLTGTEIKSAREGRVNIRDAYAREEAGEMWLFNAHISPYDKGNRNNHEPMRPRKLLLHRDQIRELSRATEQKGQTIVPLAMYLKRGRAKLELGVARGRRSFDKREVLAKRDADRDIARALRHEDRR
jgi:SsrA-binding protein